MIISLKMISKSLYLCCQDWNRQRQIWSGCRGCVVPELAGHGIQIYWEFISLPWRIIYRITGKKVKVLAVLDGHHNLEDVLLEWLVR